MASSPKINYVEFPASDLPATKAFFTAVFGWKFEDYGPDYCAFSDAGVDGGFYKSDLAGTTATGSALVVFHCDDLPAVQESVEQAGGVIVQPIFDFPGGRRFHFTEPSGNEMAVWSSIDE